MPILKLYRTWKEQIRALRPKQRIPQIQNFAWMMVGIYQSRSVHLSKIAGKVLGSAKLLSTVRRFERFLDNKAIEVREWYEPIAKQWIEAQWQHLKEIRLIVDGTKVGFGHQLLMVSLAYRRRSIPIAWDWVKYVRGHSSAKKHIELLRYVKTLLPKKAVVFLVGDSEFGSIQVMKQLNRWRWYYALRQKSNTGFRVGKSGKRQSLGSFVKKSGDRAWLPKGFLTQQHAFPAAVLIYWKAGEQEPWCLATNLSEPKLVLQYYKRRMWIDEMFGDLKRHGFDLESTMLRTSEHLSRLTLVVAYLFDWLISAGTKIIRLGLRHLVDRKERRDLCLFQIGWRFVERQILRLSSFPLSLCTYS
jgi:Transposase DDE domain